MSFDIGQKVVCVDDQFEDWVKALYTSLPKKDAVYVVRDVRIGATFERGQRKGAISILLVGLVNPGVPNSTSSMAERGFNSERFRPLDEVKEKNRGKEAEPELTEEVIQKVLAAIE